MHLPGLSQAEIAERPSLPFLPTQIVLSGKRRDASRGSMPALFSGEPRPDIEQCCSSYVQSYLQRDIKDLSQVGDELAFLRFLTAVAARTGQVLQRAELGRDVGASAPTATQWLSLRALRVSSSPGSARPSSG